MFTYYEEIVYENTNNDSLLICCPISSSIRGHLSEVPINGLEKASVIASSIIQTLSWQNRKAKFIKKVDYKIFEAVLQRLLPLIGAIDFLK